MKLHVVYRITGADGPKPRPPFYSKDRCLASFLQAVDGRRPDSLTFLHDGAVPPGRHALLKSAGDLIVLPGVGNSRSSMAATGLVEASAWHEDDLVYFAEDDYLYRPDALRLLVAAAQELSKEVGFFTLYDHPDLYRLRVHRRFKERHPPTTVGVQKWRSVRSTTMTFGARVGEMRRWTWLFSLACRGRYPADFDLWSALQGVGPYRLLHAIAASDSMTDAAILRGGVRRMLHRRRPVALVGASPALATHVEIDMLAPGIDWPAVADAADAWLADHGRSTPT